MNMEAPLGIQPGFFGFGPEPPVHDRDTNPDLNPTSATEQEFGSSSAARAPRHSLRRGTIRLRYGDTVYLRTGRNKLIVGVAKRGDTFEAVAITDGGRWAWGYSKNAARAGWVNLGKPGRSMWTQVDRRPDRNPGRPRDYTRRYQPYVTGREKRVLEMTYTRRARVINPNAKLYANVTPSGRFKGKLPANFRARPGVGLRFSPEPGAVVVFSGRSSTKWGIMRRSDVRPLADPKFDRWQRMRGTNNRKMFGPGPN